MLQIEHSCTLSLSRLSLSLRLRLPVAAIKLQPAASVRDTRLLGNTLTTGTGSREKSFAPNSLSEATIIIMMIASATFVVTVDCLISSCKIKTLAPSLETVTWY